LDLAINQLALGHLVDSRRANSNVINRYDTVSFAGMTLLMVAGMTLLMVAGMTLLMVAGMTM